MTRFDAVGFGALNLDTLFKVNKIATADEESFIINQQRVCGGSAANTIVGLKRLGCTVGFIGKVAQDREGNELLAAFSSEGVHTKGIIQTNHGNSGTVMGFIDPHGARALYVDPGVNDTIDLHEIKTEYVYQTQFLHYTSFVGEPSFQTQIKLVETLPSHVKLSFDPGELYAARGLKPLEPIIKRTFIFMPSENELNLLTGKTDYRKGAEMLLEKGVTIVAVKLGHNGCYVTDGRERHLIKPFKVNVVDTTGAGDAFCAGFLYGLISRKKLYDCGKLGNFVASRCIRKTGARNGLPHLEDLSLLHQMGN